VREHPRGLWPINDPEKESAMAKQSIPRLHAVRKAPTVMGLNEDLVASIGHHLEVVRMVLAERHDSGEGLDSGEVSSLHHVVSECSSLLWNRGER
jgi:hypothetical protein